MRSHDERRHRLERPLGVVGVHLVEVHEARVAAGRVLVRRDHRVAGHRRLGDVADVHEVGPVPQLLCACSGRCGEISTSDNPMVGAAGDHALAGTRVVPEVMAGDVRRAARARANVASTSYTPR